VEQNGVVLENGNKSKNKVFHPNCLICSVCSKPVMGKFFTIEGKEVCGECAKREVKDDRCPACGKEVQGDCLIGNGQSFHPDCIKASLKKCSECDILISGNYYTLAGGKVVCEKDYEKIVGTCSRCGLLGEGKIFQVSGGLYHEACLSCIICCVSLVGKQFGLGKDNSIYCPDDFARLDC